ncbi:MAG: hypothetical protein FJX42_03580 [Alphaproteobacteria bacterium]|nr:hypothetical protein [Alphaproteobacteria bacterium]
MKRHKAVKWIAAIASILLLAYGALWLIPPRQLRTILLIENQSRDALRNVALFHNGEIIFTGKQLGPGERIALSEIDPLKGPLGRPRRGDVYETAATAEIAFVRNPDGREERHVFAAGGHDDISIRQCLFVVLIKPQSVASTDCIRVKDDIHQTKPKKE